MRRRGASPRRQATRRWPSSRASARWTATGRPAPGAPCGWRETSWEWGFFPARVQNSFASLLY
ncbi:hypothetical protein Zm00014a_020270 [Zea mays]|uniref:Uncharacterized protein n=1 Tax=Zea mays TaxID=4577 RepID=A0A3L6EWZ6_MAIZE|nr:hypothetical protein Zm00014a_020270 [Zea mays]